MNRLALGWIDTALELEAENRALRELLISLLWWIAEVNELSAFARKQMRSRERAAREAA